MPGNALRTGASPSLALASSTGSFAGVDDVVSALTGAVIAADRDFQLRQGQYWRALERTVPDATGPGGSSFEAMQARLLLEGADRHHNLGLVEVTIGCSVVAQDVGPFRRFLQWVLRRPVPARRMRLATVAESSRASTITVVLRRDAGGWRPRVVS